MTETLSGSAQGSQEPGIQSSPEAQGTAGAQPRGWSALGIVGDSCYCVVSETGQPVVAGPLPKWLAELIALAPEMAAFVTALSDCARSIEPDEDGSYEYDVDGRTHEFLYSLAARLEPVLEFGR